MKRLKNAINQFIERYYVHMLTVCSTQIELARSEGHRDEDDEVLQWVELYEKYAKKYKKLTGREF